MTRTARPLLTLVLGGVLAAGLCVAVPSATASPPVASPAPGARGPTWSTTEPSKRMSIWFCTAVVPGLAAKAKASEYEAPGVVATTWLTPFAHVVFSSMD